MNPPSSLLQHGFPQRTEGKEKERELTLSYFPSNKPWMFHRAVLFCREFRHVGMSEPFPLGGMALGI